jgi:hypothetical protein
MIRLLLYQACAVDLLGLTLHDGRYCTSTSSSSPLLSIEFTDTEIESAATVRSFLALIVELRVTNEGMPITINLGYEGLVGSTVNGREDARKESHLIDVSRTDVPLPLV